MNTFQYDKDLNLLRGSYNETLDIDYFHDIICNILSSIGKDAVLNIVEEGIGHLNNSNGPFLNQVQAFGFFIGKLSDQGTKLLHYQTKSTPWIKAIKQNEGRKKMLLLDGYFKMTSQYVALDLKDSNENENEIKCLECQSIIDQDDDICPFCASLQTKFVSSTSYNQQDVTQSPKPPKTSLTKFWEKYLRYQGRLDININPTDIDKIKTYLEKNFYIASKTEEFRSQNMSLLRQALTDLSLGRYRDDINILMNIIWNYKIPDYSAYDIEIENNWNKGNEIISCTKNQEELQNITHNDWRLYRELKDVGIECDPDDFQITNNKDVKNKMESLWKIRCKEMGKKYEPVKW